MGSAPKSVRCSDHGQDCTRVYDFQFAEDRTRFFRNPIDGSSYSYSLGHAMPDTKAKLHAEYERRGIEPVTPKTMPDQWKENQEYAASVRAGGARDTEPKIDISKGPTVRGLLRESNIRIP